MTPVGVALARTLDASIDSDTAITLNTSTTWIRVYAIAKDVYLKWGVDPCAVGTFDEVIIAGSYLDLEVPFQVDGTLFTDIHVVGRESGATVIVIEK